MAILMVRQAALRLCEKFSLIAHGRPVILLVQHTSHLMCMYQWLRTLHWIFTLVTTEVKRRAAESMFQGDVAFSFA